MQVGGLGSGHSTSDHHITNCIHDHHGEPKTGGMAMKASASAEMSAARAELQQEDILSLSAWLRSVTGNGKGLFPGFRDGAHVQTGSAEGRAPAAGSAGSGQAAASHVAVQTGDPGVAAMAVQSQAHFAPGLSPAGEAGSRKRMLLQKIRERLRDASGKLSGGQRRKDPGFQEHSFRAAQEKPGEHRQRHSRDTVEIHCARTEESYLMDSYDRKGEYSRLTTRQ